MRRSILIFLAVSLVCGLACFLAWNMRELYYFKKTVLREQVENSIAVAALAIQNDNGSLLNNLSRVVSDKDFDSKMAFAAGFTRNSSKITVTFDDDTVKEKSTSPEVLHVKKAFFKKRNIVFRQDAVLDLNHFDSVLKHDMDSLAIRVPYKLVRYSRHDSAEGDTILSEPFIIDFTQPVMYRARYVIPQSIIIRQLTPYIGFSVLLLGLIVAGFVFVYRAYRTNEKSALFRQVLLGNFAHELKTPVTSLQLIIDATQHQDGDELTLSRQHVGFAASEIARIKLLLDKMLSIGKMTREGLEYNREIIPVQDLVVQAVDAMRSSIEKAEGKVTVVGDNALRVEGDSSLLVNVITVLLDNSLKYGGVPPEIEVAIGRDGDKVTIAVHDNGKGILPAYSERIFEPFFRVPAGDVHPVPGHGLGLSFAKEVIKLHKGKLELVQGASGATFIITLASV